MKLNSNTTPTGANNTSLKDTLWEMSKEVWALENIAHIGKAAAFDEVEPGALAHQFEALEGRLEVVGETLRQLSFRDELKPATPAPAGSESQALLALLLEMLKQLRQQNISGNEFEASLETAVSLASSLAEPANLNPVTGIKGGDV